MYVFQTFRGWCSVKYYEYQHGEHHHKHAHHQKHQGHFEEKVEIDKALGKYEKIEVPHFDECKKASIVHDFEKVGQLIIYLERGSFKLFSRSKKPSENTKNLKCHILMSSRRHPSFTILKRLVSLFM